MFVAILHYCCSEMCPFLVVVVNEVRFTFKNVGCCYGAEAQANVVVYVALKNVTMLATEIHH